MKSISDIQIRFIGAGNMASSIIGGLLNKGLNTNQITATNPGSEKRELMRKQHNIEVYADNNEHFGSPDIVVMAVKPQVMKTALQDVRENIIKTSPLVLSVAAGLTVDQMQAWLDHPTAIIRTMPNTPALIGEGVIGMFGNKEVSPEQRHLAEQMMDSIGTSIWAETERDMDIITAISGSGPAYFFTFIKALQQAAENYGLTTADAALLAQKTAVGAALLADQSDQSITDLINQVTSPKGTTDAALTRLKKGGFEDTVTAAVEAAFNRSVALSADND